MSITLAIETSTRVPSLALLDGDLVLAECHWETRQGDAERLIAELMALMDTTGISLSDVALYAVGLGPGAFTALRMAVVAAQALALPAHTPVTGVCSADAIALAARREAGGAGLVLVVGDARRKRLWAIPFPRPSGGGTTPDILPYAAAEAAALMQPPGILVASPDWNRLAATIESVAPASATLVRRDSLPLAADIGRLAIARFQPRADRSATPLEPLYVHPPVFVEPRFTQSAACHSAPIQ